MILFSAVAANHLELVAGIENVIKHSIPIVNCPKCLSFWSVLAYGLLAGDNAILVIATAMLCAFLAIWLELLMGFIDTLYNRIYEQIYSTADTSADDTASADSTMPALWLEFDDGEDSECP